MKSILMPTLLLIFAIVLLSFLYVSFDDEIEKYDEQTGQAIKGEDFWNDYVTGNPVLNISEDEQRTEKDTKAKSKPSGCSY